MIFPTWDMLLTQTLTTNVWIRYCIRDDNKMYKGGLCKRFSLFVFIPTRHISPTVYATKSNTLPPCEPRTEVINTDVHLVWNLPIPYFETPISIPDFNTGTLPKMIP